MGGTGAILFSAQLLQPAAVVLVAEMSERRIAVGQVVAAVQTRFQAAMVAPVHRDKVTLEAIAFYHRVSVKAAAVVVPEQQELTRRQAAVAQVVMAYLPLSRVLQRLMPVVVAVLAMAALLAALGGQAAAAEEQARQVGLSPEGQIPGVVQGGKQVDLLQLAALAS